MERPIIDAVAMADLILCWLVRAVVVLVLLGIMAIGVLAIRGIFIREPPPIDYDAPGVDVTSEGPDGDWTEEWYKMKDGDGHE